MLAHVARVALLAGSLLLGSSALAQAPAPAAKGAAAAKAAPAPLTRPAWNELTPAQRDALAPLGGMWATLETDQKEKWLEVARRYPNLSSDGQKRVQQRMVEFAKLTPEQRRTARENFRRAYELSAEERQEKLQKYQQLPEDKKRELATRADRKGEPARRAPPPGSPQPVTKDGAPADARPESRLDSPALPADPAPPATAPAPAAPPARSAPPASAADEAVRP